MRSEKGGKGKVELGRGGKGREKGGEIPRSVYSISPQLFILSCEQTSKQTNKE